MGRNKKVPETTAETLARLLLEEHRLYYELERWREIEGMVRAQVHAGKARPDHLRLVVSHMSGTSREWQTCMRKRLSAEKAYVAAGASAEDVMTLHAEAKREFDKVKAHV